MKHTIAAIAGMIVIFFAISQTLSARTLEEKEAADPLLRLKQTQQEARSKELKEIDELKAKIEDLKGRIQKLDHRMNEIKDSSSLNQTILDEMLELVTKKEELQTDLEGRNKDLSGKVASLTDADIKRKEEMATLKADLKKDERNQKVTAIKQDLRKYEKIISSPSVKDIEIKESAWRALVTKYPKEAEGVTIGDIEELQFKVKYGGITNSIGMKFVLVQVGTFSMGSPETEAFRSDDETRHKVTLKKPFYLQTTEVTQAQWIKVMGNNPSEFNKGDDVCPVENVSWEDCQVFIQKLNKLENTNKYRLPTEAEWEYACRGGRTSAFANGNIMQSGCNLDANLDEMGWYCANSNQKAHPVAQKKINAYGLYDMHGNVWEWCQDWYGAYPSANSVDPTGARYGPDRVIRGGSCLNYAEKCRSAYRFSYRANIKMNNIGFRVARTK